MYRSLWGYVASITVLVSALLLGSSASLPSAIAATPVGTTGSVCDVEPRSFDDIAVLASTPTAPTQQASDSATPANDEVIAAITETVAQSVACANANDVLRSLALFTDRYVAERFGVDHPDDLGSLDAALSRTQVPAIEEDLLTLVSVEDVMSIDKTWATAHVITENRAGQLTDQLGFESVDGRWLIDSWTAIGETPATPTS